MLTPAALIWLMLLAPLVAPGFASAQTLYRCGSTYQDQPCSAAQPSGSVVGGVARVPAPKDPGPATATLSSSAAVSDPLCRQRGMAAEKIRWAKEGGRTLEQAEQADAANKMFLQDVYARLGTAAEVRVSVEADCNDEQRRAEEAARLNAAAAAISAGRGGARPAASSGAASSADGTPHH